jgi:zinc-binding alcohol dehydrogenase family protein
MKAVGLTKYLPIDDPASLQDVELPDPIPEPHDLLVRVQAVSVNPVDTKVRAPKEKVEPEPRVLGWDAAGVVEQIGNQVEGFSPGDRVYYAGDITRSGSNAELQNVDARIVAKMPQTLDFADAASLPLTALTASEALFERMGISDAGNDAGKSILIVGGAGGVGSLAIQLAKRLGKLNVIASASRNESRDWVTRCGADAIVNHRKPLDEELKAVVPSGTVDFILCLNSTAAHWPSLCRAIAPQGTIASIVETSQPLDMGPLMAKSARFAWEFMFTRSMFKTSDMTEQGAILTRIASLVDSGYIRPATQQRLSPISAATLKMAHARLESGSMIGKLVVAGW